MRAKKIFVVAVFSHDTAEDVQEIMGSADQLWNKYSQFSEHGALVHVQVTSNADMDVFEETRVTLSVNKSKGDEYASGTEPDVGVYVVAHGYDVFPPRACVMSPRALAELIKWLEPPCIRKMCLVICQANRNSRWLEEQKMLYGNATYLSKFCQELGTRGLSPMIAGWERFITICRPDMKGDVMTGTGGKTPFGAMALVPLYGKKISSGKTGNVLSRFVHPPGEAKNAILAQQKTVYQYRDGQALVVTEGWSDKS